MSKARFELNIAGLRELMKSGAMQAHLDQAGAAVASAAGSGYGHRTHLGSYTAICNVYPDTAEAAKENYEKNTLLKAAGSLGLPQRKGSA